MGGFQGAFTGKEKQDKTKEASRSITKAAADMLEW